MQINRYLHWQVTVVLHKKRGNNIIHNLVPGLVKRTTCLTISPCCPMTDSAWRASAPIRLHIRLAHTQVVTMWYLKQNDFTMIDYLPDRMQNVVGSKLDTNERRPEWSVVVVIRCVCAGAGAAWRHADSAPSALMSLPADNVTLVSLHYLWSIPEFRRIHLL